MGIPTYGLWVDLKLAPSNEYVCPITVCTDAIGQDRVTQDFKKNHGLYKVVVPPSKLEDV